jgi:hypothetical protein
MHAELTKYEAEEYKQASTYFRLLAPDPGLGDAGCGVSAAQADTRAAVAARGRTCAGSADVPGCVVAASGGPIGAHTSRCSSRFTCGRARA